MDFLIILEQYGVPIAVAIAFGFFIWKQNKYIQDDLSKDIHQKFNKYLLYHFSTPNHVKIEPTI